MCAAVPIIRNQAEIAKATGYSPSQVSRILSSPDFKERYEVIFRDLACEARSIWLTRLRTRVSEAPKDADACAS
jgi:hypothetical protein